MKVLIIALGDYSKASSRVRVYWIFKRLNPNNVTIVICDSLMDFFRCVLKLHVNDIVIFQKVFSRWHYYLLIYSKLLGKRTFFDIDDFPSRVQAKSTLNNFERFVRLVDGVSCGNKKLLELCSAYNDNCFVIPSCIDIERYSSRELVSTKRDFVVIGWVGNGSHYEEELIWFIRNIAINIIERFPEVDLRINLVGVNKCVQLVHVLTELNLLAKVELIEDLNWADTLQLSGIIRNFDIGIYPLIENKFNLYKCGFKSLEYGICGIPTVASSIEGMENYIKNGETGFLCTNPGQWLEVISNLINNESLRVRIGGQAEKYIINEFSIDRAISSWNKKLI